MTNCNYKMDLSISIFILMFSSVLLPKIVRSAPQADGSSNGRLVESIIGHMRTSTEHESVPPIRPVACASDRLSVIMSSALYQVVDLDQRNNLATISAYFDMSWVAAGIGWDPADYDGTRVAYVPASSVWIPELYLYHSVQGSTPFTMKDSAVQVNYTGGIRAFVPFTARALCPINVKHFPFDIQTCNFKFGSWSYTANALLYLVQTEQVYLGDFYDNQEWLLTDSRLVADNLAYVNDLHNETYSMVTMTLRLQRQSFYYVFNLVIPVTLVSLVAIFGFHAQLSCDGRRTAKYRLGIMTLLSMGVMLLMLVDDMPKFALTSLPGQRGSFSDVPLLGLLYVCLISLISICTCVAQVFVLIEGYALSHPSAADIPRALRWVLVCSPLHVCCATHNHSAVIRNKHSADYQNTALLGSSEANGGLMQLAPLSVAEDFATPRSLQQLPAQIDEHLVQLRQTMIEFNKALRALTVSLKGLGTRTLEPHWDLLLTRLELISLTFFLAVVALLLLLFNFGPYIY